MFQICERAIKLGCWCRRVSERRAVQTLGSGSSSAPFAFSNFRLSALIGLIYLALSSLRSIVVVLVAIKSSVNHLQKKDAAFSYATQPNQ